MTPFGSRIDADFTARFFRGEPIVLELELEDAHGAPEDVEGRAFFAALYHRDGQVFDSCEATVIAPTGGRPFLQFAFGGFVTDALYGEPLLRYAVAERVAANDNISGNDIILDGALKILPAPVGTVAGTSDPTGAIATRFVRRLATQAKSRIVVQAMVTSGMDVRAAEAAIARQVAAAESAADTAGRAVASIPVQRQSTSGGLLVGWRAGGKVFAGVEDAGRRFFAAGQALVRRPDGSARWQRLNGGARLDLRDDGIETDGARVGFGGSALRAAPQSSHLGYRTSWAVLDARRRGIAHLGERYLAAAGLFVERRLDGKWRLSDPGGTLVETSAAGKRTWSGLPIYSGSVAGAHLVQRFANGRYVAARWDPEDGALRKLGFKAASPSPVAFAPRNAPDTTRLPIHTDGRTMAPWRARLATLKRTGVGKLRIGMTGDSWTEYTAIPQQLASLLYAEHGKAGEGWINLNGYMLNGVTRGASNWTVYDAGNASAGLALGCDWSGQSYSTTANNASFTLGNIVGSEDRIYYRNTTGSFRYSVDGGVTYTTVTGDGTNTLGVVTIMGLSPVVAHSLWINTAPNTGGATVTIYGVYSTLTAGNGIELMKIGNAGLRGSHIPKFVSEVAPMAALLPLDALILFLTTNDYRTSESPVAVSIAGQLSLLQAHRTANPTLPIIVAAPARTNGTVYTPLSDYRDAQAAMCRGYGFEFWNMHEDWGTWAEENARGMFADDLHLNENGGFRVSARLNNLFLSL